MRRIGFTNKYYTLWDISVNENYSQNDRGQVTMMYETVRYTYLGNLSFDLQKAQEKAQEKGCADLEPDTELYGRNTSWEKTTKKIVPESLEYSERGELITICCSNNPENTFEVREKAIQVLLDKGFCENVNGIITVSEHVPAMKKYFADKEALMKLEIPELFAIDKNPDYEGRLSVENFCLLFDKVKENYYNGFTYYLPLDAQGKTKRIKNKKIQILEYDVDYSDINEFPYDVWKNANGVFYTEKDGRYLSFNQRPTIKVKNFKIVK
jgi:hypothetical protein